MIAVIDYGAGNLRSVCNALTVLRANYFITNDPSGLERGAAILLPGVGHFGQMMQALDSAGITAPLRRRLEAGTPYLGICLGMQALFERSEEAPEAPGFGLLPGSVLRFPAAGLQGGPTGPPPIKVPHMGWTAVEPGSQMYYFAHSYYVPAGAEGSAATAEHGVPFTAILRRANLAGSQFHPEKSGAAGLEFLRSWIQSCQPSA